MRILLLLILVAFTGCAKQLQSPLEEHKPAQIEISDEAKNAYMPTLVELLTFGIVSDKNADIKAYREAHYKEKYVSDEDDERSAFGKAIGTLTFGIVSGRETKKQRAERLKAEALAHEQRLKDERDAEFARLEETLRLELEQNTPLYHENAVFHHPVLGKLVYEKSSYDEAVELLNAPIRLVTYTTGEKEALFKFENAKLFNAPVVGEPQINVRLHFNEQGILVRK